MSHEALRALLSKFTQINYEREMAFVAVDAGSVPETILGVVRAVSLPGSTDAEYAIIVRSDMKGVGLGHYLMRKIIEYSRSIGTRRLIGEILIDNHQMRRLARRLGFSLRQTQTDVIEARLDLHADNALPDGGTE
jgi:acetyltransferase